MSRKYTGDGSRVRPLGMNIERLPRVTKKWTRKTKMNLELNLPKDVKDIASSNISITKGKLRIWACY